MDSIKLGAKFNALLLLIFIIGSLISGITLSAAMQNQAETEIVAKAEILLQTMNSVRKYTKNNIKPLLSEHLKTEAEFIPETVPAYSAKKVFENFRQQEGYQSFLYKEATLNPTNPRDKADEFEIKIIEEFRQHPETKEKTGYHNRNGTKLFYIARPLSGRDLSCWQCYGKPEATPHSIIDSYGVKGDFGWELDEDEIVAAQTIYVPAQKVLTRSRRYWYQAIAIFITIFTCAIYSINLLLKGAVIQPLKQLTSVTRSLPDRELAESAESSESWELLAIARRQDEPGQLARAFQHLNLEIIAHESRLKQAQAEIKHSEAYFRALIEQASDVIFILDRQQTIVYASHSVTLILGYQPQVLLGQNLFTFIPEDLHFTTADFLKISAQTYGISIPIELSFRHQNGSWLAIEAIANNLLNDRMVNGIVLNLRDITEREQADQRLRLLESVVVNTNDAIVITEAESLAAPEHPKIVYVNKAFCQITGYSSAEIIGKTPRILQGEKTDRRVLQEIKQSLSRWLPIKTEIINYAKDGREYWVELNIIPIADSKGNYTHYVAVERDITERKHAEQELRDREAFIRNLYEVTTRSDRSFSLRVEQILTMGCQQFDLELGIISKIEGEKYRVVAVNQLSNSSLEVNPGEIYSIEDTCCAHTIQAQQPTFEQTDIEHPCYLDINPQAYLGTKVMVDGEIYGTLDFSSLHLRKELLKAIDLELIELMAQWIGGEIERKKSRTKLAQARDAAEAANKAKGEFLATMSHEIRTPMNAVIGMTGLLLNTKLNFQQQDFVETIRSSGNALLTLINDILDFSKIEAGKLELENQPFHLDRCIEEALNLVASAADAKQLELAYLMPPHTPNCIVGDVTRLRQILVNLLSNAVKFTEQGEVVIYITANRREKPKSPEDSSIFMTHVRINATNRYQIEFAVKDTGIGIPQDRLDRLFKSFSQVDASTTRQYGGTGLGLAISKKLAKMMGGNMWVESEAGVGSTFYFNIAATVAAEEIEEERAKNYLVGKQVLIVDDNATNRQILQLQTKSWGMIAYVVESGAKALEIISEKAKLDLAILDMQMPKMDGLTLARIIRQEQEYQDLPLVMLSSLGKQEIIQKAQDINFAAIVNKPIPQSQLYQVLARVIGGTLIKVKSTDTSLLDINLADSLPLNILLAEDIVVNQKVALLILKQMGYRADVANNGIEVLTALRRQAYDVVLMDVQMPEMDGMSATEQILREFPLESRPRIIAMTANAMIGEREKYLAAGMDDYVSKPIRVEELRLALSKCKSLKSRDPGEMAQEEATAEDLRANFHLEGAIDFSILESICEMAGAEASFLLEEMIDSYLEDTEIRLNAIADAIKIADMTIINEAAHSMKSSSANLGAINLAQLCAELEQLGREQTMEGTESLLANVKLEFQQVEQALRSFLITMS